MFHTDCLLNRVQIC